MTATIDRDIHPTASDTGRRSRAVRIPRRLWVAGLLILSAVLLLAQNSVVLFPNVVSYRLLDERTIALTVGVAPCAWTRVTGAAETETQVRITVETLPCPIPGPGTASLALRELTVSVANDIDGRTIADAEGHEVPIRASEP